MCNIEDISDSSFPARSRSTMTKPDLKVVQLIENNAQCLRANEPKDYDSILSAIGDGQIVLIGEASHGIWKDKVFSTES